jgi:hypothetical protein
MKNVLVITYSQSGQLDQIVESILKPLQGKANLFYQKLKPIPSFPFPWNDLTFWDVMPESVEMIPSKIEPLQIDHKIKYDLVLLGYPIWFLSPPIPLTTFLKSEEAKKVFNNKIPVVTVIGSRNMWVGAQEEIKKMIAEAGGNLVGNISLHDRHHNLPSVVTITYWMMTGKKDRYLGIFPKPGVSEKDINEATKFGKPVLMALDKEEFANLQSELLYLNAVELDPSVVSIENKGKRIFKIWSKLILKKGGPGNSARATRLKIFKWYLLFVIFAVSPIATLIFYMTYPFFFVKINRKIRYYKGVKLQ